MEIKKCRACGAPIVWITTTRGKFMPCDAEAVQYQENKKGKDLIVTEAGAVLRCNIVKPGSSLLDPIIDGTGYISHYATCPNAGDFRRKL